MIGIIISCIGMLGILILLTAIGFNIDWKFGVIGIFLTIEKSILMYGSYHR